MNSNYGIHGPPVYCIATDPVHTRVHSRIVGSLDSLGDLYKRGTPSSVPLDKDRWMGPHTDIEGQVSLPTIFVSPPSLLFGFTKIESESRRM